MAKKAKAVKGVATVYETWTGVFGIKIGCVWFTPGTGGPLRSKDVAQAYVRSVNRSCAKYYRRKPQRKERRR